ncbi:MAG TPA: hypothetical protein DCW90_05705, partial [Lachnospiraceae bacterium]|nr:hypothetical protein [Lachnospiraceae bacterium]
MNIEFKKIDYNDTPIRYVVVGGQTWLVAKDVMRTARHETRVGKMYSSVPKYLKKYREGTDIITVINVTGVKKFLENFPSRDSHYVEYIELELAHKPNPFRVVDKESVGNLVKKIACYNRKQYKNTWTKAYVEYSAYVGYNVSEKAKE